MEKIIYLVLMVYVLIHRKDDKMNYTGIRVITNDTITVGGYVGAITDSTVRLQANTE